MRLGHPTSIFRSHSRFADVIMEAGALTIRNLLHTSRTLSPLFYHLFLDGREIVSMFYVRTSHGRGIHGPL